MAPGQLPPRTIAPRTIPTWDNCPLGNSPGQLPFSWLFSVSFSWPNCIISVFCYDNKNDSDNSNKTWSLKLLRVIICNTKKMVTTLQSKTIFKKNLVT